MATYGGTIGKLFVQPWEDRPPPLLSEQRDAPQNFQRPALNGGYQAVCEPYLTGAWKSLAKPNPPAGTPPYSAMKWHPYLINCESWKFCTRDSFSLHLTVIELHSHAISFTTPMRRKESGGGGYVSVCERALRGRKWRHRSVLNDTATGQHNSP